MTVGEEHPRGSALRGRSDSSTKAAMIAPQSFATTGDCSIVENKKDYWCHPSNDL
ncbi:uncharacterized protein LOC143145044 isoform X2 [Ptiloglossa arizonensis]|uniref:uncharacterized protein LOC143145044 isoform X2 n=1 Tax=Ptiloglossa arizonensis TaxID=3350558 RepID=UPI003F9F47C4